MSKFYMCNKCGKSSKGLRKGLCWTCNKQKEKADWMEEHMNGLWRHHVEFYDYYNCPHEAEKPTVYSHDFFMGI